MTNEICINTVELLNNMLYMAEESPVEVFRLTTDGYYSFIVFGERTLWSSEDDERKYTVDKNGDDTEELETLYTFLKREFNEYIDNLNKLKIK